MRTVTAPSAILARLPASKVTWGSEFRVSGSGIRVPGFRFRVLSSGGGGSGFSVLLRTCKRSSRALGSGEVQGVSVLWVVEE